MSGGSQNDGHFVFYLTKGKVERKQKILQLLLAVKKKNHMIISKDAEHHKIHLPFMMKVLKKTGKEETFPTIIKATYNKPRAITALKGGPRMRQW